MAVGTLTGRVVLDRPNFAHCGSDEPVTGRLFLSYRASSKHPNPNSNDLFGPLQANVSFHGRAKTRVVKSTGNSTATYRGRVPLFAFGQRIYDGPVRLNDGGELVIPFSLPFPSRPYADPNSSAWERDHRFFSGLGVGVLPPSMHVKYHGFAHRFDAFVEYRMDAQVRMPQIDVKIAGVDEDTGPIVIYEQPRVSPIDMPRKSFTLKQAVTIQNKFLLPEADRPSGFREKTKALFNSDTFPKYCFSVNCTVPTHLNIGSPIIMEIRAPPDINRSTAPLIPDITVSQVTASIQAYTEARAEVPMMGLRHPHSNGDENVGTFTGAIDPSGPFSKSHDWTKEIRTKPVAGPNLCSMFETWNIARYYTMKIRCLVECAGETTKLEGETPIQIHPPLIPEIPARHVAEAGPSGPTEAIASVMDALPSYERPPDYHEKGEQSAPELGGK